MKRGNSDVSTKVVLVLAVLVVLIVASSTWLVLDKLSEVKESNPISVKKIVEQHPPSGGMVGLTILNFENVGEENVK